MSRVSQTTPVWLPELIGMIQAELVRLEDQQQDQQPDLERELVPCMISSTAGYDPSPTRTWI